MIHLEAWYREAFRRAEEVAADLLRNPEDEALWEELWLQMRRDGQVPTKLVHQPSLYPRLVPDFVLPLYHQRFLREVLPPLHEYALHQADIEDEDVQLYLLEVGEKLSEKGEVEELEALEDRIDEAAEGMKIMAWEVYDKFIFIARMVSWGVPWETADDLHHKFREEEFYFHLGPQGLRSLDTRGAFVEVSEFDYAALREDWRRGQAYREREEEGDALRWRLSNSTTIDVWSTFAELFGEFPHAEFWIRLHDADSDEEVREAMA